MMENKKSYIKTIIIIFIIFIIISCLLNTVPAFIDSWAPLFSEESQFPMPLAIGFMIFMLLIGFIMFGLPIVLIIIGIKRHNKRQHKNTIEYLKEKEKLDSIKLEQTKIELESQKQFEKWICPYCNSTNFKKVTDTTYFCKHCGGTI